MSNPADAPIAPAIVDQASYWLMLHWDGQLDAAQSREFLAWKAASPEHLRAWQRLEHLQGTLSGIPANTARTVLHDAPDHGRRNTLKLLGLLLVAGGTGYAAHTGLPWRESLAELRTRSGEIRRLKLADGSRLALNSGTAVDIHFSERERRIRLIAGEILVSNKDDSADSRTLIVETAAGDIQALGTRFAVRKLNGGSRAELYQGELEIRPRRGAVQRLQAGEQLWFSADSIGPIQPANHNSVAWKEGRLVAERQPLGQFLAELGRHRPGLVRCEDSAADLLLTGVFPLADTDHVLATLEQTLPIKVTYRTPYWVMVSLKA